MTAKKKKRAKDAPSKTVANKPYGRLLWLVPLVLFAAILYSGVGDLGFQMHWDDHEQVVNNSTIKSLSWDNLEKMFSDYVIGMYQPLTSMSYALDYQLAGLDAGRYHNTNLLLHVINVILVWILGLELFRREDLATVIALIFAIHPLQVETVCWISTRSNLLFTSFFMGGLIIYQNYLEKRKNLLLVGALGAMLLSCLSKSMAVTFPLALLCLDFLANRKDWTHLAIEKAPFFILSLIFGIVAISYTDASEIELDAQAGLLDRVFFVFYSLHFYLTKFLLPINLSAAHYFPVGDGLPLTYYLSPITLLVAALPGILIKSIRKDYFVGLLFFAVTIALVVIVPGRRTIVSERYLYLPMVGLLFALVTLLRHWLPLKNPQSQYNFKLLAMAVLVAIPLAAITASRKKVWQNSYTLFTDVVKKYPENYHSYAVRGLYLIGSNQAREALPQLQAAIERKPDFHEGHYNLGIVYGDHLQQPQKAIEKYTDAIRLKPSEPRYFIARGTLHGRTKQYEKAEADFAEALELNPESARAYENRGVVRTDQKLYDQAIADYTKSIELDANNANTYISRGAAYSFVEAHEKAIEDYQVALKINPQNAQAYYNLGVSQYKTGQTQQACNSWKRSADLGNTNANSTLRSYCGSRTQ